MSLDDTLDPIERAKLAVWDYPVSNKYTKLWETMKLSGFPNSLDEALTSVKNGTFAYIGMAKFNMRKLLMSTQKYFIRIETSVLQSKGCKFRLMHDA